MESEYERWRRLLRRVALPAAIIDLDALDHNARVLGAALDRGAAARPAEAPALRLRIASKSVRSPALLRHILDLDTRFQGLMAYHCAEARLLTDHGHDDILVAYPPSSMHEARIVAGLAAAGRTVSVIVDSPAHLQLLDAAGREQGAAVPVVLDLDASWRPLGGVAGHFGVRRSPVRDVDAALALAQDAAGLPCLSVVGLMAYEAQVAGIQDQTRGSRLLDPVRGFVKGRSVPLVRRRRQAVVAALAAAGHVLELVNGGGTGSVASTAADPTVTEVTAGSGFLCPHLFDGYADLALRPAAFFALGVSRTSDPGVVTCFGGGYTASGPPGADRSPIVHQPPGLSPLDLEGFGEVQTPFRLARNAPALELGDPVICRHAKAGELGERFASWILVRGDEIVDQLPTHRGLGGCFG